MQGTNRLKVDPALRHFVEHEVLAGLPISPEAFWSGLEAILVDFTPKNLALLQVRDRLQAQIDAFGLANRGRTITAAEHESFLRQIGYLVDEPSTFEISTGQVDPEIALMAGPQLVVPLSNARYALNAANARWGSLYDALYGTDALSPTLAPGPYNADRGAEVIAYARRVLDEIAPLAKGSHADAVSYGIAEGRLVVGFKGGGVTGLTHPDQFIGSRAREGGVQGLLLKHNGLHCEIVMDRGHPIGASDPAGVCDLQMESALTAIQDCEDSVAAIDAEDKIGVYRTWLGLMKGDLTETFVKDGRTMTRRLNPDRAFVTPNGQPLVLKGRAVLLVRNVGHHMVSDAVLSDGQPVYEAVLDALITVASALHDRLGERANSAAGSVYVVKPKLHGPDEVALTVALFDQVEAVLGLERNTVKLGIMDEERRTSVNLAACIHAARERVVFINTGFLDRTGDEIHTAMAFGPMQRKAAIKTEPWLTAYEKRNVEAGLAAGFRSRAQIGKGMWAAPDQMQAMLRDKIAHPRAGANTAWVPSPTAATLHALHYHRVNVAQTQEAIGVQARTGLSDLLTPPLAQSNFEPSAVQEELDNNIQGLLGYVVRWIDQGIGCSKVPDIYDVGLMEDRATLRISSQHVANWLYHGVCSEAQVRQTFARMAKIVDQQNASDPAYRPMGADLDRNIAYQAGLDLVFQGAGQPNGYTEFILHSSRKLAKAKGTQPLPA